MGDTNEEVASTDSVIDANQGTEAIQKSLDGLTSKVLDKTKSELQNVRESVDKDFEAVKKTLADQKKVAEDDIETLKGQVVTLQKSLDLAKKGINKDYKVVEKPNIYVAKYGKVEEGTIGEMLLKNKETLEGMRASHGRGGSGLIIGYYKNGYFTKASSLSGEFDYQPGNISREERVTRIADEGPNFTHRIINNLPTAPFSQQGNTIRYNYLKYSDNKATAVQDTTSSTSARLTGNANTERNVGPRQIGLFNPKQSKYDFGEATAKLALIQSWVEIPMERLDDTAQLNTFLNSKLLQDHYDYLDDILLNHDGTGDIPFAGLNNLAFKYVEPSTGTAAAKAASIRKGWLNEAASLGGIYNTNSTHVNYLDVIQVASGVLGNRNFNANTLILNYLDCHGLKLLKAKVTGTYLQSYQAMNPSPVMSWNGINIIPSQSQLPGTFTLFDSRCVLVKVRDALAVEARVVDQSGFLGNNITIKTDQRLTMLAFESSGIIYGSFKYWIEEILNVKTGDTPVNLGKWGNPDGAILTRTA